MLKALSCVYWNLGKRETNSKLINKSLAYCEDNSYAYLARAEISE